MSIINQFVCVFIITCIFSNNQVASTKKKYLSPKEIEVIKNDLPSHENLLVYLTLLNQIIEFCNKEKDVLANYNYNLVYGLFLINVNLEPFVNNYALPLNLRNRLDRLLTHSAKLQYDYYNKSQKDHKKNNNRMKQILGILCANTTAWSSRMTKINLNLLRMHYTNVQYPEWSRYKLEVCDFDKGTPNPRLSDKCMTSLAESEENRSMINSLRCQILSECYKAIIFGTDYGYWLTHRLIYLQQARLSRGCAIFSVHDDELLRMTFCGMAYNEVKFNAFNGFQIVDLVLEQIALCTLDGHAQFIRKSWLPSFLDYYQNSNGCFHLSRDDPVQSNVYLRIPASNATEKCNVHTMAVAAGTFAGAVRFILENY